MTTDEKAGGFRYQEAESAFPYLSQLIGGYMHQDMDIEYDSISDAVAGFAEIALPQERAGVKNDLERLSRRHNEEPDVFHEYFGADLDLAAIGVSFEDFAAMVIRVVDDPAAAKDFDI
ncbi:MAG: contact-dependent growth inhibition system immunity protein [Pseudomonadota bacterium]